MKNQNLTFYDTKTTVLRSFQNGRFLVCKGKSFYSGLNEFYKEFDSYIDALDYFNTIKRTPKTVEV